MNLWEVMWSEVGGLWKNWKQVDHTCRHSWARTKGTLVSAVGTREVGVEKGGESPALFGCLV